MPVALTALTVLLPAGSSRASFFVSPMEVHFEVAPERRGATPITISNTGKRPITLKLYLSDSRFHPDGSE
jgi:P pilus assembly chaperone PapD